MNSSTEQTLKPTCYCEECLTAIQNTRLMSYLPNAVEVLSEYDLPIPVEHKMLGMLRAALDARAILVAPSETVHSVQRLQALLDSLILFCVSSPQESIG
jgi:hypothetical protein